MSAAYGRAPAISVVIPTRNRLRYLQEAIQSVHDQTYPLLEIVVVDDASSDETRAWLGRQRDAKLRTVFLDARRERSAARNAGLEKASSDWLLFFDDDDRLAPRGLEALAGYVAKHPGVVGVSGSLGFFDEAGREWGERWVSRPWVGDLLADSVSGPVLGPNRSLLSRHALRAIGGWPVGETPFEDYGLSLRLAASGRAGLVPDVVGWHRVHGGQSDLSGWQEETRRTLVRVQYNLPAARRRVIDRRLEAMSAIDWLESCRRVSLVRKSARVLVAVIHDPLLVMSPLSRNNLLRRIVRAALPAGVVGWWTRKLRTARRDAR